MTCFFESAERSLTTYTDRNGAIGSKGACAIAGALKVNAVLTSLDISWNHIGAEGAKAFAEALNSGKVAALTTLELAECNLTNYGTDMTGITALAEALQVNAVLTHLDLGGNVLCATNELSGKGTHDASGITALAEALRVNAVLKKLVLSPRSEYRGFDRTNGIGPELGKALAVALQSISSCALEALDLQRNDIGSEAAKHLAEWLKVNTVLTTLSLELNKIDKEGGVAIAEALKSGTSVLTDLNLAGNELCGLCQHTFSGPGQGTYDASGIIAIAEALKSGMSVLTALDLSGNRLDADAGKALREAVKGRENFRLAIAEF